MITFFLENLYFEQKCLLNVNASRENTSELKSTGCQGEEDTVSRYGKVLASSTLGSQEGSMMVNGWRTGRKQAWDVPRGCWTYLVQ